MARPRLFPIVFRNPKSGSVALLYRCHVEYYGGYHAGVVKDNCDCLEEMEMLTGNGYKQIRVSSEPWTDEAREVAFLEGKLEAMESKLSNMRESCPEGGCLVEI